MAQILLKVENGNIIQKNSEQTLYKICKHTRDSFRECKLIAADAKQKKDEDFSEYFPKMFLYDFKIFFVMI